MVNRIVLVGRLTRDPEKKVTASGTSVAEFSIAVDKQFKREGEPDAFFFRVKAWGKTADFVGNYLTKGRLVSIDGRLEQRKYQASDGGQREIIEVVAESVQGLDRAPDDQNGGGQRQQRPAATQTPSQDEYDPFCDE